MMRTPILLAAVATLFGPYAAQARDGQAARHMDPAEIDRAVAAFVKPSGSEPQPVDRRLRLRPCGGPLAVGWHGTGQRTVKVACPQQGGWLIHLAVRAPQSPDVNATASLVRTGDRITVRISGRAFSVTAPGEALAAGGAGAIIPVRVRSAATILRARIEPDGTATAAVSAPPA